MLLARAAADNTIAERIRVKAEVNGNLATSKTFLLRGNKTLPVRPLIKEAAQNLQTAGPPK
jgi:hypothetical protein